ncbi:MAG: protein kinase [Nannocystaceae bacterium]|nr:protein kinase [Nannocystaceae bacterium]
MLTTVDEVAFATTQYRRVTELASGGMGVVEICVRRSGTFERLYAVKRLHPHLRGDESMRAMFVDEARVAGLLRHANVVSVLDVGEDQQGPFLVMDYIEGVSLSRFIRLHARASDLPPVAICTHIASQIARGLHAAHELVGKDGEALHLVHRDVSPQNVLVGHDGVVRVTDFGVAKALGRSTHTSTGLLKGKVGYMAPEHLRFEPLDRRTDLFALGVVFFELLTARRLYPGRDASEVARTILNAPPPDFGDARADVAPALVELAFRLLAKDPADRPGTAAEVADRLDEIVAEEGPVDLAGYIEARIGPELRTERARIRELAAAPEQSSSEGPDAVGETVILAQPRISSRRRTATISAVAGIALAAVAVGMSLRGETQEKSSVSTAVVRPQAPPQAPSTVTVQVDSHPQGATVKVGGHLEGRTPLSVELPVGEQELAFELSLPGYVTTTHQVVPSADERLVIALSQQPLVAPPVAASPRAAATSPKTGATQSKRGNGRSGKRRPAPSTDKPAAPDEASRPRFRRFD